MTKLGEVLRISRDPVRVDDPIQAKLISVKLHGQGAVRRVPGDGKAPQPFVGNRGSTGQFVFSRIWARKGAMALIPKELDGVVVTNEFPIFDIDHHRLDPRFFIRLVQTARFLGELEQISAGASGQNRVKEAAFLGIDIILPSLEEQQRIAAILDQADALRAKRRAILVHLDTLTQSIFHTMFDGRPDEVMQLNSLIDQDDRMNYGVVQPGDAVENGVPLIRVSDLVDGTVNRESIKFIAPEIEASYQRSRIRGHEILVSSVGSIGVISVVSAQDIGSNVARAITRVPISNPITRSYVSAFLRTETPQRYFREELRTVAQPTLNVKQLAATRVPVPPLELQREFAARAERVNAQRAAVARALEADDELFAALQSAAFTGAL